MEAKYTLEKIDYNPTPEIEELYNKASLLLNQVTQEFYSHIEKKLIERLKLKGFEINEETAKRVTRIDRSSIELFNHEFWIDYNTEERQFLFLVYSDYKRGMLCFEFAEREPLGGTPITGDEIILKPH